MLPLVYNKERLLLFQAFCLQRKEWIRMFKLYNLCAEESKITENVTKTLQRDFLFNVLSNMKRINCVVL